MRASCTRPTRWPARTSSRSSRSRRRSMSSPSTRWRWWRRLRRPRWRRRSSISSSLPMGRSGSLPPGSLPRKLSRRAWRTAGYVLGGGMLAFLVVPVVALFVTGTPTDWLAGIRHPITVPALLLSLTTTALSLAVLVVFGTPLAWWLGRSEVRVARLVETVVQLPIVVPPAVAGLALLRAFGRRGLIGPLLDGLGIDIAFSTIAVVLAQVFVAAPFYIQAATAAFAGIDENPLVGPLLEGLGIDIAFSTIAVVLAQVFVAAPFYIQAATTAFANIDENLLVV